MVGGGVWGGGGGGGLYSIAKVMSCAVCGHFVRNL